MQVEKNLQKQLNTQFKKEAEDCIKIYNKLKELAGKPKAVIAFLFIIVYNLVLSLIR